MSETGTAPLGSFRIGGGRRADGQHRGRDQTGRDQATVRGTGGRVLGGPVTLRMVLHRPDTDVEQAAPAK
ncbi:hypothetical protein [Amycolatopsis sp. cmx-11-12]|uniref:hypothetical protein n=1 Tax=Amycolatopsis sp. cmx-11-12 TaxID=2785795 RepID=UPI0039182A9A